MTRIRHLYTVDEAEKHLARLLREAEQGIEVVITRGEAPAVALALVEARPQRRRPGTMKGRAVITDAFWEPLPPEELDGWNT